MISWRSASGRSRAKQMRADVKRVRLQSFVAQDVEHREPDRARHRVPAERAEVLHPVVERVGDRARRRDRADRMAVAERLSHHDDVGHDVLILERPEARAHAPESGLHFVGDAHAAAGAHVLVHLLEIARREDELSADARARLGDERRDAAAPVAQFVDDRADVRRVLRACVGVAASIEAAIVVGQRRDVHPVGRAATARTGVLVRTDVDERRRVAVIRGLEDDHVACARSPRARVAARARSPRSPN